MRSGPPRWIAVDAGADDRRRREGGFTLPEALVACTLTLLIVAVALGALNDGLRLTGSAGVVSDTDQTLQAAMSLMVRDFIQTGGSLPTGGVPIPSGVGATPVVRPSPPGPAQSFPAGWTTLPAVAPGASLGPSVLGVVTDTVTLTYADPTIALNSYPLSAIASDGSNMTVDSRTSITGADGIQAGDAILFTNALGNAIQIVSSTDGVHKVYFAAGDALDLNQRGAAQGTLLKLQSSPGVFPPTTATRVLLVSYYLDATTDPSTPRLVRQVNGQPGLAIALGVENLQFSYDLVDGQTNPTDVESPVAPNSPNQIRKVNIYLAARSMIVDPSTGQYFRNSMASEVEMRSLSFVNRYK